jgi:hypothetical protein
MPSHAAVPLLFANLPDHGPAIGNKTRQGSDREKNGEYRSP